MASDGDQLQPAPPNQAAPAAAPPPRRRPLVPVLFGFAAGIALDSAAGPPEWVWIVAAPAAVLVGLWAARRDLPERWNWLLALLLLVPAGGLCHDLRFRHQPPWHLQNLALADDGLYYLQGRVTQDPQRHYREVPFAEEGARSGVFWVMRVELDAISGDDESWQRAAGGLSVFVNGGPPAARVGDTVRFLASVRRNRAPTNPGERDSALSYARSGSYGTASVPSPAGLAVIARAPWYSLSAAVARLRARVDERLQQEMRNAEAVVSAAIAWLRALVGERPKQEKRNEEAAGIVQGLLTGERNGLTQRQSDLFKESGTMQFLAVSGLHVGIFCLFIGSVLVWTSVPVRLRALLTISLVWLYILFTGFQVPAIRAGWMISFVLAAPLLERRRDAVSGLACSALLILIYQPQQLFVAGFQLTFVAMWAMMCTYPQLAGIFWPWQDFLSDAQAPEETSVLSDLWFRMRSYLLLSVTVWLATAPILVCHFNLLCYQAPLLNLAIWPLVMALMPLCFIFACSLMAFGLGAGLLAGVATVLSLAIQTLLEASSHLPGFGVYVPDLPLWWVGLFFLGLSAWVMRWRTRWGRVSFVVVVLALSLTYIFNDAAARAHRQFRLTLLDVGHGQTALVELPTGETMLFDAGADGGGAAGARALADVLWDRHVDRIDVVCISHMDADHLNFLPFLARRFTIGRLVVPRAGELSPLGVTVRQWARKEGLDLETLGEGDEVRGGALLCRVLHPSLRFVAAGSVSENSKSLVLRCEYEGLTFLVPGDIEDDAMQRLVRDYGAGLTADVLVLPHHGLPQAALGKFVAAVAPQLVLASGPEDEVANLAAAGPHGRPAPLWITGREGAIIITFRAGRARVLGWKSGRTMDFTPVAGDPAASPGGSDDG